MNDNPHALFQIAAKAIIKRDGKILLLITHDDYYDFPGGRMNESEIELSLKEVLSREIVEELGDTFDFSVDKIAFVSKRRYDKLDQNRRILAVFYETTFRSGDITLSQEHARCRWVDPISILKFPQKFISPDEFNQYQAYCQQSLV